MLSRLIEICVVGSGLLSESSTAEKLAPRSVLQLDGQWRLTNEGVGPLPSRTYTLLHNHSLVDPLRGSWSQYPTPQPAQQTTLQVTLPAADTADACCDACAKTPGCGAAAWDGSKCEARAANSVPIRYNGSSCDLIPSSDFHPGCVDTYCLGAHTVPDPESCCKLCASTAGCAGAVLVGDSCYLTTAFGTAGGTYTRSDRTVCIPRNTSSSDAQQIPAAPAACVLSGGAVDLPATVPGDVNDELMKAKLLPNLLVATNSMEARWVPQYEWRYERKFTLPPTWKLSTASSVALHFAGVDYNCSVSLNGKLLVAAHAGSFRPINLDVTSVVRSGSNANSLSVTIHAPPPGYMNALFTTNPLEGGAKTTYTVGGYQRDHFSAWKAGVGNGGGVDFGTPAFSLGIWKSVELRYSVGGGTATLDGDRAAVIPVFPPGRSASLSVATVSLSIPVRFASAISSRVRLTWSVSCIRETGCGSGVTKGRPNRSPYVEVIVAPSPTCESGCTVYSAANLTVHHPELWWPNGYGEQKLYTATATLSSLTGDLHLDSVQLRFGFRKLELTDNVPDYPAEIRAMQNAGFLYADYGSCPRQPNCNAAGWSERGKAPCAAPVGRTDCACPWCGGPWIRNSSGPAGPDHLPGQGPLPPNGPRNITQGDATQKGWTMLINNRRVFARGANWVPVDLFFGRVTNAWLEQAVALSAAANMNFYRVWGGGIIEKQAFFDACDTHGIMLLSEMPHMGPRPHEELRDGISNERASQVLLGEAIDTTAAIFQQINHPSVVQWGYANEEYVNTSWSKSLDQYERIVRTYDHSRPVHAANPIPYAQRHGPYNFYAHRDQAGLVCNSYDTYNWGMGAEGTSSGSPCGFVEGTGNIATGPAWPYEWDEVGACGMCSLEQLHAIIPNESARWPINGSDPTSAVWHWHAGFGVQRNDTWLSPSSYRWLFMHPRGPNGTWPEALPSLKDEFEASQFLQAEGYRYIFQSNRRARWHRSAVAIWTLNEPFPNAAHGCIFDYSGHPKHAFYLVQESLAQLDVSLRYDRIWTRAGMTINATVYIDDEGQRAAEVTGPVVVAEAWSAKRGSLLHTQTWSLHSLNSQVVTEVGHLQYIPPLELIGDTVLVLLESRATPSCDSSTLGCVLSRHTYTFGVVAPATASNVSRVGDDVVAPLKALRAANTTCVVASGFTKSRIAVRNIGKNIALNVKLSAYNRTNDKDSKRVGEVKWVAFDGNYFSLRPGETRHVHILQLGGFQSVSSVGVSSWNQLCGTGGARNGELHDISLKHDDDTVTGSHAAITAAPLTITDFWHGRAHFELISKSAFPEYGMRAMNVGFHFVTRPGGIWYLFHREYNFAPRPEYCVADWARIVVRKTTNQGRNWTDAHVIATPSGPFPGSGNVTAPAQAPDECALTDGAGYYDERAETWHYLSQCNNRTRHWMLCHYSMKGADPMNGLWVKNKANPVVVPGQLWSKICAGGIAGGKSCDGEGDGGHGTHDEGTPEIVKTDTNGFHYVTFHGCNDWANRSARGVARTRDFVHWETSGHDLPGDAIFGQVDCNRWNVSGGWANGTCIGGGEGSIINAADGYMYMLIEAPDISLGCLRDGQNWVLGLLRSKTFGKAGTWEQFNEHGGTSPTVVPYVKQGCFIQYHRLFSDDQGTYLEYWAGFDSGWMQIHRLVPGKGPLPIVATDKLL